MEKNDTPSAWLDTPAGQQIQAKLTEERTLAAIDHLLSRIDTLEKTVEHLTVLMQQGPGLVAMVGDMADETYRQADAKGVSIDQRLGIALQMAERLTEPKRVAQLESLFQLSEQLPGMVAMTVDTLDEGMRNAMEHGFNPKTLADVARTANTALTNARAEPPAKVGGLFGILRVLRDPDRQKGLGFLMNFLKHFGRNF